ncbi:MAG: transposase [Promethearchaeota archaeon]
MGVENFENDCRTLITAKVQAPIEPFIITCDFNPSLIAAIKHVFPNSAVQIDGFHVMQELNNGIKRDLKHYARREFREEIDDFLALRAFLNALQEERKKTNVLTPAQIPNIKEIKRSHSDAWTCKEVIERLLITLTIQEPDIFFRTLDLELSALLKEHGSILSEFCDALREKFPKRKFTLKGRSRVQGELLKNLKTLCVKVRKPLQKEVSEFSKERFILFKQPEKVSEAVKEHLEDFLERHPSLRGYREMTLSIGEIYREPYHLVDGRQIDALTQKPSYSDKLNTVIATLKKYKSEIIAFAKVFLEHPELGKACRANMEWLNKGVKAPFKASLNRQSLDHVMNRMELQLGGEVRNFIS